MLLIIWQTRQPPPFLHHHSEPIRSIFFNFLSFELDKLKAATSFIIKMWWWWWSVVFLLGIDNLNWLRLTATKAAQLFPPLFSPHKINSEYYIDSPQSFPQREKERKKSKTTELKDYTPEMCVCAEKMKMEAVFFLWKILRVFFLFLTI